MIRYQGDNIDFSIEIEQRTPADVKDWSSFTDVAVYLYTSGSRITKFTNSTTSGYGLITLSDDKKRYVGRLLSDDTKLMLGALQMEIYLRDATGSYKRIRALTTGIEIRNSKIKTEVK